MAMKSLTEHLWFEVPQRRGFVNITPTVEELVRKSGVQEGLCLVNAMHITAAVAVLVFLNTGWCAAKVRFNEVQHFAAHQRHDDIGNHQTPFLCSTVSV